MLAVVHLVKQNVLPSVPPCHLLSKLLNSKDKLSICQYKITYSINMSHCTTDILYSPCNFGSIKTFT